MAGRHPRAAPRPVVGPGLRRVLFVVFGLFAVLSVNAAYLGAVTLAEHTSGASLQGHFYQYMFLAHVVLGLVLILPFLGYAVPHLLRARHRPNRRAVHVGLALFATALALLAVAAASRACMVWHWHTLPAAKADGVAAAARAWPADPRRRERYGVSLRRATRLTASCWPY